MANFRRGAEAIRTASERKGNGKFTPTMRWKAGEKKYILFLQSIDEIPTVLMHNFVITGISESTNKPQYNSFISRRDPALDGLEGYDELMDRFEETPKERNIALAVELSPVFEKVNGRNKIVNWDIETRQFEDSDGKQQEVPNVALIIESPFTFYGYLSTYADDAPIEGTVFGVTRRGGGTDTAYDFVPVGDAPEIGDALDAFFETFDFDAYLDELADEERMRELISPLDDDWVVNPYNKKRNKKKESSSSSSSRTRTRRAAPADEVEESEAEATTEAEDAPEEGAEETPAAGSATSRRFKNLRKDFGQDD